MQPDLGRCDKTYSVNDSLVVLCGINTLDMRLNCSQLTSLPSLDLLVPTNLNWSCFTTSAVFK